METLLLALQHAETTKECLTISVLQSWHGTLVGNGIHAEAGMLRTKNVHAGTTYFAPKERVRQDMQTLLSGLQRLESRLVVLHDADRALGAVAFAAAVFFGLVDTHGFADGNGRLSRIALNWALRRAGVPFVVNLFATPSQRAEYVSAIRTTRRNTTLLRQGQVVLPADEAIWNAYRMGGCMVPLVELIMDRMSKAIVEVNKLITEKASLANEEAEVRIARRFRERAAAGSCMICLDEYPNIATLCCGKAVHLNCIATWLSERNSCPQCRADLPTLPRPVAALQQPPPPAAGIDHTSDVEEDTSDTTESVTMQQPPTNQDDDTMSETEETTEDTDDTTVVVPQRPLCQHGNCQNVAASDCTNGQCGNCCIHYGTNFCSRHPRPALQDDTATTEDDTTSEAADEAATTTDNTTASDDDDDNMATTSSTAAGGGNVNPFCSHGNCRNRAASDCSNTCCGRCCVLHGRYSCVRHSA